MTVDQKALDDFEKAYVENCDQKKMRLKHRNAGPSNPFHPQNVPPEQYRIPEHITASPTKVSPNKLGSKSIKYSGKMGKLGYKLLVDSRKAA